MTRYHIHTVYLVERIPNTVKGYSLSSLSLSFPSPENGEAQPGDYLHPSPSYLSHADLKRGENVIRRILFINPRHKNTRLGLNHDSSPKIYVTIHKENVHNRKNAPLAES